MRILILSHSCVIDINQQLLVAMSRLPDTELALLLPSNWVSDINGEAIEPKYLPEVSFPVFARPVRKPGSVSLFHFTKLPLEEIRSFKPDVVLSFQEPWSLSGQQAVELARRLNVPFLFETNQNIFKRYPPPFSWFEQRSYRRAARALAYSEEARQVMLQKGLTCPSEVVPYATDIARFGPGEEPERRAQWGLTGATVVGYMGRFVPEKGLSTLLKAFAAQKDPHLRLLMVGAGPDEAVLKAEAETLGIGGQLVFTGVVSHLEAPALMRCMDVFVLPSLTTPSWKEQFGRVLIEALACKVPLIGSDSGQIPHLIRDTAGGLIFPEGDAEALTERLQRLLQNPSERAQLAEAGYASVHARYTCEAVAKRLRELCAEARGEV